MGAVTAPPGAGSAWIEDRVNSIEIELAHDAMTLADADAAALDAGANLAMIGGELIQFGHAEPLGDARWRLSRLWRGRRGTEATMGGHAPGERFALLHAETIAVRDLTVTVIGGDVAVLAQGVGDGEEGVETMVAISGAALMPPSPVHFAARLRADGGTDLSWVRRSRNGWRWIDGANAPIGEENERYALEIAPEGGEARIETLAGPHFLLTAEEREASLTLHVRQVGTHGLSLASTLTLPASLDA